MTVDPSKLTISSGESVPAAPSKPDWDTHWGLMSEGEFFDCDLETRDSAYSDACVCGHELRAENRGDVNSWRVFLVKKNS